MEFFPKNIIIFNTYITENFGIHYPTEIIGLIVKLGIQDYLIIDMSNTNKLSDTFRFVYSLIHLDHVLYNGFPYYQYTSRYGNMIRKRPKHDPNIVCKEFYTCSCTPSIYPNENDTVEYIFDHDNDYSFFPVKDDSYYDFEFIEKVWVHDSRNVLLIGYNKMNIQTNSNFYHNNVHHCKIYLKTYDTVIINGFLTLRRFMAECYKIKKLKFTTWYEEFREISVIKNNDDLDVTVRFVKN